MDIEKSDDIPIAVKDKDPIIEYLKLTKLNNMPPHKIAFKKMRENEKMAEEDSDEENIAYNLT
jgi:hypothetical protein